MWEFSIPYVVVYAGILFKVQYSYIVHAKQSCVCECARVCVYVGVCAHMCVHKCSVLLLAFCQYNDLYALTIYYYFPLATYAIGKIKLAEVETSERWEKLYLFSRHLSNISQIQIMSNLNKLANWNFNKI